ncbi:hypothetical protein JMJ35_009271 [Cladonia borealis]|uniref:F-box domain-containing protein n=1 Tax=Cladonia borealis TaxID=184061 RepID=A0AA39QS42_9LECA|nr:hypothetical protein JMJ35_009271 [Cladonia borealis]
MLYSNFPPKKKAICPWVTIDSSNSSRFKMKMTTPWLDYLLCQLSAEKPLSTLETLPAELLDPILEELHSNSIVGLRAFAGASRTCRALASPYFFKPMRAHLDKTPYAVLLSATEGYKTLKVHSPSTVVSDWEYLPSRSQQWEQKYPSVSSILNIESTFTCIELRVGREAYRSYIPSFPLDILRSGCPMISKLTIELDDFRGYSTGWDWCLCEFMKNHHRRCYVRSTCNNAAISEIARFANLRYLTTHFLHGQAQFAVMGPRQERQAAFDFYKCIDKQKCGVRLERLDVVFHICEDYYARRDVMPPITMTVCPFEKPKGHRKYSVTCDDARFEKISCRTAKALGLGGLVSPFGWPCPTPGHLKKSRNEEPDWPFDVDTLEYE